jgi:hypothetical protein
MSESGEIKGCSPSAFKYGSSYTCYSLKQLRMIAKAVDIPSFPKGGKQVLWKSLREYFGSNCDEACWIDRVTPKIPNAKQTLSTALAPLCPMEWYHNPSTWLSNHDIDAVMKQYSKRFTSFKFLGVYPIDFADNDIFGNCISPSICDLNIRNEKASKFGIVFNLDRHDEPGSHWVAVYIGKNPRAVNYGFYYFDSFAQAIPPSIKKLGELLVKNMNTKKPGFKIHTNHVRKQFGNTECGMFCLHFLIECLSGREFSKIITDTAIGDQRVQRLRSKYYRCNFK